MLLSVFFFHETGMLGKIPRKQRKNVSSMRELPSFLGQTRRSGCTLGTFQVQEKLPAERREINGLSLTDKPLRTSEKKYPHDMSIMYFSLLLPVISHRNHNLFLS